MYRLYADMLSTRYQESHKISRQTHTLVGSTISSYNSAIRNIGSRLVRIGHKLEGVNLHKERYSIRSL